VTLLAPTLQAFFTTRMTSQFGASPHTVAAYRDTWRLLLTYLADATGTPPENLDLAALTPDQVSGFLTHLEVVRGNAVSTRNTRLAAIHAFFGYAAYRHPEHAATISQVMAIPAKRHHRTDLTYLTPPEVAALLAAPDQTTRAGRRDHALLQLAVTAGLRVSELTSLNLEDLHLGAGAHVVCRGKGRKNRVTPLDAQTAAILRAYIAVLPPGTSIVFPTRTGTRMSRGEPPTFRTPDPIRSGPEWRLIIARTSSQVQSGIQGRGREDGDRVVPGDRRSGSRDPGQRGHPRELGEQVSGRARR